MTQLVEHRLDVGFLRGPVDEPSLTIQTLIEDPLAAVVCDDHALAAQERIAPTALADQPIVLWTRTAAPTTYADVIELFRKHHIEPQVVDESPRIQTILALVASGAGIALLPTSFINLNRKGVRFIPLSGPFRTARWPRHGAAPTSHQACVASLTSRPNIPAVPARPEPALPATRLAVARPCYAIAAAVTRALSR